MKGISVTILLTFFAYILLGQHTPDLDEELRNAKHDSTRLRLYFIISDYQYGINQQLSKKTGLQALQLIQSSNSPKLSIQVLQHVANRHWEDGEYSRSIDLHRESLKLARLNSFAFWEGKAYHLIGMNYFFMSDYDSTLHYFELAKSKFHEAHDTVFLAKVENHIGLVKDQQGDYPAAMEYLLRSMGIQEKIKAFSIISFPLFSMNQPGDSIFFNYRIERYKKTLAFEQSRNNKFNIAQTLRSIGRDYLSRKNYRQAFYYFKESSKHYAANEYKFEPFWSDFAEVYLGMGQLDSAKFFARKNLTNMFTTGSKNSIAEAHSLLGEVALAQEDWQTASGNFQQAVKLYAAMGNKFRLGEAILSESQTWFRSGHYLKARSLASQALTLSKKIGALPQQAEALKLLFESDRMLNKTEHSLADLIALTEIEKKLSEGSTRLQVAKLTFIQSLENKETELKALQEQKLLIDQEIKSRNLQIALVIAILLIITSFGFIYFLRYRQNKKMNEWLLSSNHEKEALISEIYHRVKNNLQIISSLINLKSAQASSETSEILQQLNGRIYSLGLIHEKLFKVEEIQFLRLDHYLQEICNYLMETFTRPEFPVALTFDAVPVKADTDQTLACGLICNEVITNSLKHAFTPDQKNCKIGVTLTLNGNEVTLIIFDNGGSFKPILGNPVKSFGLRFVDQLVKSKLAGTWSMNSQSGLTTTIQFGIHTNGKNKDYHH